MRLNQLIQLWFNIESVLKYQCLFNAWMSTLNQRLCFNVESTFVCQRWINVCMSAFIQVSNSNIFSTLFQHIVSTLNQHWINRLVPAGIFVSIISSKLPKDVFIQMELQRGARSKWSVNKLRELLHNYVCATERAEELSHSKETKHETEASRIVIKWRNLRLSNQNIQRKLFVQCIICDGNHWSDQCL